MTALHFIHVVGGDQNRHAARGKFVNFVPEGAPRLGIDARGRLIQHQEVRLVDHASGQRQALLPAARQRAGQLRAAMSKAKLGQGPRHAIANFRHAVGAGDEGEILRHR